MRTRTMAVLLVLATVVSACDAGERAAPQPSPPATSTPVPTPSPTPTPRPSDPFALAASYEAPHAAELAQRLERAERAIADPGTGVDEVSEHARVQQAAYRQLVVHPDWVPAVKAALPADLHPVLDANVEAGAELRRLTAPRDALPDDWRIVAPAPVDELLVHYRSAAEEFGIDWTYLAAIHLVETRMGRIRGTSVAGARGPMQFLPSTWEAYGEGDIESNRDAIRAAARYLRRNGAPDRMRDALWAYNHSDRYVRAVSIYAERMRSSERNYRAYHAWEVYYRTTRGDALLPVGWSSAA